jgi:hypothetical protein
MGSAVGRRLVLYGCGAVTGDGRGARLWLARHSGGHLWQLDLCDLGAHLGQVVLLRGSPVPSIAVDDFTRAVRT